MGRRILITGSRNWTDEHAIHAVLADELAKTPVDRFLVIIHGGAKGADTIAGRWAYDQLRRGRKVRYEQFTDSQPTMIEHGAEVCHAFPLGRSSGTRQCMAAAEAAGIPVIDHGLITTSGQNQ